MKRASFAVLAAIFVLTTAGVAVAHPPDHGGSMGVKLTARSPLISIMLRHQERLGLSEEQATSLQALRSNFKKKAIKLRADLRVAEIELDELLEKERVDLEAVEAKVKQIEGLRARVRVSRIRTIEEGRSLLSPEQRKKLTDLPEELAKEKIEKRGAASGMEGMEGMEGMMESRQRRMGGMMRQMNPRMVSGCPGMMGSMMGSDSSPM